MMIAPQLKQRIQEAVKEVIRASVPSVLWVALGYMTTAGIKEAKFPGYHRWAAARDDLLDGNTTTMIFDWSQVKNSENFDWYIIVFPGPLNNHAIWIKHLGEVSSSGGMTHINYNMKVMVEEDKEEIYGIY